MDAIKIYLSDLSPVHGVYADNEARRNTDPFIEYDCHCVMYIGRGSGRIILRDTEKAVDEGDILLLAPGTLHRFMNDNGRDRIEAYCCFFYSDVIRDDLDHFREIFPETDGFFAGQLDHLMAIDTTNKDIRRIFIRMLDEILLSPPGYKEVLFGFLPILLANFFRNLKTRNFERVYSQNRIVDEAMRYINKHIYSKLSLDNITEHLHVSPSLVCRVFKKHVGMTTSQVINMLRVEKIKDILRNTAKPVKSVPELFDCNPSYLSRVFKSRTGMTMQEYHDKYNYKSK